MLTAVWNISQTRRASWFIGLNPNVVINIMVVSFSRWSKNVHRVCRSHTFGNQEMVQWAVGSIPHGGPIELFLIPTSVGYMVNNQLHVVRKETHCCHYMGYSVRLAESDLLYPPSHRQDSTYHCLY